MNEVIVSVRAMKIDADQAPRLSPWAEAFSRKFGRRISKSPSRLRPNATKSAGDGQVQPGVVRQVLERRRREEEREEDARRP